MTDIKRSVDEWGRVTVDPSSLVELLYDGVDLSELLVPNDGEITKFNELCKKFDKADFVLKTPEKLEGDPHAFHAEKASTWSISEEFKQIPVREFLLSMCTTDEARRRVNMEMDMFEQRELIPLLQLMIFLVDNFRTNKVVWGVGRGSSVSSYCLYLIGVHKIDSLKYNLDINDFLK